MPPVDVVVSVPICNRVDGFVVPIPTFPALVIIIRSTEFVLNIVAAFEL